MRISIDGSSQLVPYGTGITVLLISLLRQFAVQAPDIQFRVYMSQDGLQNLALPEATNIEYVPILPRGLRYLRPALELALLPMLLRRDQCDLFFSPSNYYMPLRTPVPSVLTVYDLSFKDSAARYPSWKRLYYDTRMRMSIGVVDQFVTISNYTRDMLRSQYGISHDQVKVICPAVDAANYGIRDHDVEHSVRKKYDLSERFILSAGTHQRKNVHRVANALSSVRKHPGCAGVTLVIVGPRSLFEVQGPLEEGLANGTVRFLGFVPEADLNALYSLASMYVSASSHEGFGITLLEAMAHGIPVVCSDIDAHQEVADKAALFFPRDSEDLMAQQIVTALTDQDIRQQLIDKGYRNVERYSAARAASQYLDVFRGMVGWKGTP